LLSGRATVSMTASTRSNGGPVRAASDNQELARRVLTGVTTPPPRQPGISRATRIQADAVAPAQRVLLGVQDVPAAGL
jgi:hypothetical protein